MRSIITGGISLLLVLILAGPAWAENGLYMRGALGAGFLSDSDISNPTGTSKNEFDNGWSVDAALGYRSGMWRVEGELGYQKNGIDQVSDSTGIRAASGDYNNTSLLVNVYADFANATSFTPFLTTGMGVAKIKIKDFMVGATPVGTASDVVFAWQIGAGVGYEIKSDLTIDFQYRYFGTRDPKFDNGWRTEYGTNNISLGLRYNF